MKKTYSILAVLVVVVLVALYYGFTSAGSPFAARRTRMDQQRVSAFSSMNSTVQGYYYNNGRLPQSIEEATNNNISKNWNDPESGELYKYEKIDGASFRFCATFSTDTSESKKENSYEYDYYDYYDSYGVKTHKKGYDCITYELQDSYLKKWSASTTVAQ